MKNYNELNKTEQYVINEYKSWAKSDCPVALKLEMLNGFMERALGLNIHHLIIK